MVRRTTSYSRADDREQAGDSRTVGHVRILNRIIIGCDSDFAQMLGYEPQDVVGMSTRVLHPTQQSFTAFADKALPVIARGEIFRTEQQLCRKDATLGWYDISLVRAAPDSLEQTGACIDITARECARRELLIAEEHYRTLFIAMAEGVVVHARDGQIIESNPAAARILGLSRDQLCGKTPRHPQWQAIREDGTPFPGDEHPAAVTLRTGQSISQRIMGVRARGVKLRWISINSQPVFEGGLAEPSAAIVTFIDVTPLYASLAKTRELAKRLEDIREEERENIAYALQEGIAHNLFTARLILDRLKVNASSGGHDDYEKLWNELSATIVACTNSTDDIANEVRPPDVARFDISRWIPRRKHNATVLIPVKCPICGKQALSPHPVIVVVTALTLWDRMLLRAPCHKQTWEAAAAELKSIRDHLGEEWIEKQRNSSVRR